MTDQNPDLPDYDQLFEQKDMCDRKQMHLLRLANKYGMSFAYRNCLKLLDDFRIAFILDDSGSMNTPLEEPTILSTTSNTPVTRWKEQEALVKIFLEVCLIFDKVILPMILFRSDNCFLTNAIGVGFKSLKLGLGSV